MISEGRLAQDASFSLPRLAGLRVEAMFAAVDCDAVELRPIAVSMKLSDGMWHRCFLDAGLAFWERWGHVPDDDDTAVRRIDWGQEHRLIGETLRTVEAHDGTLTITFESGRFVRLSLCDASDPDSATQLVMG